MEIILFFTILLLAFSNGANDISKGIATLVGGGTASLRQATVWGVVTTALGSVAAITLGGVLLNVFSKGLLSKGVDPSQIALAVAGGATLWVLVASRFGWPVSTTHALVGAIIGATAGCYGNDGISWSGVVSKALVPLLVSPAVSFLMSYTVFPICNRKFATSNEKCVCIEQSEVVPAPGAFAWSVPIVTIVAGNADSCSVPARYSFRMNMTESLHFLSSGLTSFARGLNDTPKMAALLLGASVFGIQSNIFPYLLVGFGIVIGGLMGGRRVTNTLARRITTLNPVEGFLSNAVTSVLVITGSVLGLPFSTTHVSTSSIVGMGAASGSRVQWNVVRDILLAWIVTLPCAGIVSYGIQKVLS